MVFGNMELIVWSSFPDSITVTVLFLKNKTKYWIYYIHYKASRLVVTDIEIVKTIIGFLILNCFWYNRPFCYNLYKLCESSLFFPCWLVLGSIIETLFSPVFFCSQYFLFSGQVLWVANFFEACTIVLAALVYLFSVFLLCFLKVNLRERLPWKQFWSKFLGLRIRAFVLALLDASTSFFQDNYFQFIYQFIVLLNFLGQYKKISHVIFDKCIMSIKFLKDWLKMF